MSERLTVTEIVTACGALTNDDLLTVQNACVNIQAVRRAEDGMYHVRIPIEEYDPDVMKIPYCSVCITWRKSRPESRFGVWIGTPEKGGVLHVFAGEGDVIFFGQYALVPTAKNDVHTAVIIDGVPEIIKYSAGRRYWRMLADAKEHALDEDSDVPIDYRYILEQAVMAVSSKKSKAAIHPGQQYPSGKVNDTGTVRIIKNPAVH